MCYNLKENLIFRSKSIVVNNVCAIQSGRELSAGRVVYICTAIGNNKVVFYNFSSCWVEMVVQPNSKNIFSVDVSFK